MYYSLNNVQLKHVSPILNLEVPARKLYVAVASLIADHTEKSEALTKSWGPAQQNSYEVIHNQQNDIVHSLPADAHDLARAFYKSQELYFGLAMKDIFLSAAVKGAVSCEEIRDYVDPSLKNKETAQLLKEIGLPTLAKIVEASCVAPAAQPA